MSVSGRVDDPIADDPGRASMLRRLVDAAPIGLGWFDGDLRFRFVNHHLAHLNGRTQDDHVGLPAGDLHPDVATSWLPALRRAVETRAPHLDLEIAFRPDTAGERHYRSGFVPVEVDGDVGVAATVIEVTAERVAQRRLERLLDLATALVDALTTETWAADVASFASAAFHADATVGIVDGDVVRIAATSGSGADIDDEKGRTVPLDARSPMTDAAREARTVDQCADGDHSTAMAIPFLDAGGSAAAAVLHLRWACDHDIGPHGHVLLRTATAMAEGALTRITLRARMERDSVRDALDSMLDGVTITRSVRDEHGTIVDFVIEYANSGMVDGAGRSGAELVGHRITELYPSIRDVGLFDRYVEVVESRVGFTADRMRYEDRTADGTRITGWWNLQATPHRDGYIAATRDVTEVVEAEQRAAAAQQAVERERIAVALLQACALPDTLPTIASLALAARYRPAVADHAIGGDWYDVIQLGDDRVGLVIADVAGHGLDAASLMVQLRNVVRGLVTVLDEPDAVLAAANHAAHRLGHGLFVTCCYVDVDTASGTMRWASAGHVHPVVLGAASRARYLHRPTGLPLGVAPDATYGQHAVDLVPGDRVVLVTDGVIERRGEPLDDGIARLLDRLAGTPGSVEDLCDALVAMADATNDDLALVAAEWRPDRPRGVRHHR